MRLPYYRYAAKCFDCGVVLLIGRRDQGDSTDKTIWTVLFNEGWTDAQTTGELTGAGSLGQTVYLCPPCSLRWKDAISYERPNRRARRRKAQEGEP